MKVLQILCGGAWGGGSEIVLAISSALIARGDQVWVVTASDEQTRRFQEAGVTVVQLPFWNRPVTLWNMMNPSDVAVFMQLFKLCRKERFDLVATHTSKAGFIGRLAARAAGIRCIVHHAHGFAFRDTQKPWMRRCYVVLERIAARACHLIISVSEDHRQGAIRERVARADKIVTVLNGINVNAFGHCSMQDARRMLGLETDDALIGVASRLVEFKGLEDLIRAFSEVHRSHPRTQLVVLGEGPILEKLRQEAQQTGLGERIHFPGFRRNIPDLLAAFDIIAQPSLSEGLSIAIIEALAAGKPVVACDIQGNREIITSGVNGLLAPPSNPAGLASAFRFLLDNPAYGRELGAAAMADCRARFSKERMTRQVVSVYDDVSAGRPVMAPGRAASLENTGSQEPLRQI